MSGNFIEIVVCPLSSPTPKPKESWLVCAFEWLYLQFIKRVNKRESLE